MPDYLRALARFAAHTRLADIPQHVTNHLRWVIIDSLPVMAVGMRVAEMHALVKEHLQADSGGCAWVLGTGRHARALDAALLNGTAGTWHELDEGNTYAKGHPGIQVLPATLALAQEQGKSGEALLNALAVGYEVCSRIYRAATVSESIHPHGTFGVIGAAVGAGRLLGMHEREMLSLINVSASMAMATSYNTLAAGATVRNIYTGHSGYMGQVAVQMVQCGFTGESDGVGTTFGTILGNRIDREQVVADLGEKWLAADGYFKLHPTARSVQPAIDALEDLLARNKLPTIDAQSVRSIVVSTFRRAATKAQNVVNNSFGAKFSIPFALATLIYHGRSGLDCFNQQAVANPTIQSLARRVRVVEDPSFTATYPDEQRCELSIDMLDGSIHKGRCTVARGERGRPVAESEVLAKYRRLAGTVWGDAIASAVYETFMAIEDVPDCRRLAQQFFL